MSYFKKVETNFDVIYPPLPLAVFEGREYANKALIEKIDKRFYDVTITKIGFMVYKKPASEILRKNTTPLGWAISRLFMGMRFSKAQYLSDLNKFENMGGFLEPASDSEAGYESEDFESCSQPTLEERLDDLMPSASDMCGMLYRIGLEASKRPRKPVDSGWIAIPEGFEPKALRDDQDLILGQCTETGKRFYRIKSKELK